LCTIYNYFPDHTFLFVFSFSNHFQHIISHEDHMMMRELVVHKTIPPSAYISAAKLAEIYGH